MALTKKPSSAAFLPRRWDRKSRWHSSWCLLEIRQTRNWLLFHSCGILVRKGPGGQRFPLVALSFEVDNDVGNLL